MKNPHANRKRNEAVFHIQYHGGDKTRVCSECGGRGGKHVFLGLGDSTEPCTRCPNDPDQRQPVQGADGVWRVPS